MGVFYFYTLPRNLFSHVAKMPHLLKKCDRITHIKVAQGGGIAKGVQMSRVQDIGRGRWTTWVKIFLQMNDKATDGPKRLQTQRSNTVNKAF